MRKLIAGLTSKLRPASPALAITVSCAIALTLGLISYVEAQRVQAPGNTAIVCAYNSSPPTLTSGWFGYAQCDSAGKLITVGSGGGGGTAVTIADGADVAEGAIADTAATAGSTGTVSAKLRLMTTQLGTINTTLGSPFQAGASIGNTTFGATQATAANLNATVVGTGTFAVQSQPTPVTSGGVTVFFLQPTASDNHANIKNGAGQVYKISATNNSATVNYLRLYNAASGFNGCNSATNLVYQMAIPASTSGAGYSDSWDLGIAFSTGISICVTSGYATTDTTNATASAMSVNVGYK